MANMTYNDYIAAMAELLVLPIDDPAFNEILPRVIDVAEWRIMRDLDLLIDSTALTGTCVGGSRNATIADGMVIVESVNVVTPVTATDPDNGTRHPVEPVSLEFMNRVWPQASLLDANNPTPKYYSLLDNTNIRFAPPPLESYTVEYVGTIRPAPMSPETQETYIATYYPDLFLAASMVFAAGWQRDFSAVADDPKLSLNWEMNYNSLLPMAKEQEARKKGESTGWNGFSTTPAATPARQ